MSMSLSTTLIGFTLLLLSGCMSSGAYKLDENEGALLEERGNSLTVESLRSQGINLHRSQARKRYQKDDYLTATGYATISSQPSNNPAQQRLMAIRVAKLTAYRALADQVYGQYVDSRTSIGDLTMGNDSLEAQVRGVIYEAKLERINPVGQDTYEVTLTLPMGVVGELRQLYLEKLSIARR